MPSTFSPLKIQLMATGENNTTWGDVTNLNLGTALEEAIVGSADVTFASADVTLTLTDTNASQTARNMRLRCTGTTGGATRNLVVPSIEKPYIVRNDCADSVVVKTAAGTGITVPAGKTMWVYSDATNVVDAVTHLSSLTLSTPLPVSSGGTGVNTSLTAGSVVFAGASGAYSQDNANFFWDDTNNRLGIGTNTPAARLEVVQNQAAFSYFDFRNQTAGGGIVWRQIVRNIANTGDATVDLVKFLSGGFGIANTDTNAANFTSFSIGASERMRITSAGFVGIGTSAPVYQLQVRGLGQDTAALTDAGNKGGSLYLEATANASGSGGALLFGTTFGNQTPFAAIKGLVVDGSTNTTGDLAFSTRNAISDTALTERMRLTAAGNFGIGTGAPSDKLTIVDQSNAGFRLVQYNDAEGAVLRLASARGTIASPTALTTGGTIFGVRGFGYSSAGTFGAAVASINARAAENFTATAQGSYLEFSTTAIGATTLTERMRITSAGDVGIGTITPSAKLDVNGQTVTGFITVRGDGSEGGQITFNNAANSASPLNLDVDNLGNGRLFTSVNNANLSLGQLTGTGGIVTLNTAGSERMRITAAGDVGIGTVSPSAKLNVARTDSADGIRVTVGQGSYSGNVALFGVTGQSNGYYITKDAANNIQHIWDGTGGAERMRIDTSGNVLVGTTTATGKLTVAGTAGTATIGLLETGVRSWSIRAGGSATNNFDIADLTAGASRFVINSSGNVGIGCTPLSTTRFQTSIGTDRRFSVFLNGSDNVFGYLTDAGNWTDTFLNGSPVRFGIGGTERMRIDTAGNVGIGTSSPSYLLHLNQNGNTQAWISATNSGSNSAGIGFENQGQRNWQIWADRTTDTLSFGQNSRASNYMSISGNGLVGIGTSSPTQKFEVNDSGTYAARFNRTGVAAIRVSVGANGLYGIDTESADLQLGVNGTERMRITSAGFVGVGTGAPGAQFENVGRTRLGANVAVAAPSSTDILSTSHTAMGGNGGNYLTIGQYPSAQGFAQWIQSSFSNPTTATYNLVLQPLGGNVGIGTATPSAKFEVVQNQAAYSYFDFRNQTNGGGIVWRQIVRNIANTGDATVDLAKIGSGFLVNNNDTNAANFTAFGVGASERARIDSSGNLGVGTTSPAFYSGRVVSSADGASIAMFAANNSDTGSSSQIVFDFYRNGTRTGNITNTNAATAYNTSSDYRLKEIDGPIANSGAYIDVLKPVQGSWKADGSRFIGLLAHEVQEVSETPIATGEKDGEEMQGMDYSAPELIANLIAEIQSLRVRVAQLEGN